MKTKKGFTLIEIIVCVALLSILGVSSILIANNTNKNKELENITKKVLEAANVYIETEKDKHGNTYSYGIDNGGKGITIPLNTLVNKGYVQNEDANKIKSLVNYSEDKDYYILLAETNDLCDSGVPFTKASWEIDDEEIYLCDYTPPTPGGGTPDGGENKDFITELLSNYGGESKIPEKDLIAEDDYVLNFMQTPGVSAHGGSLTTELNSANSGLYYRLTGHGDSLFYYRGDVNDNYIDIGGYLYRIISFSENEVKLITEKSVNIDITEINTFENILKNGVLYNQLELWHVNNVIMQFDGEMNGYTSNFFKSTSFCNDTKTGNYYMDITSDNNCKNSSIESIFGLITVEEANYAGIVKDIGEYFIKNKIKGNIHGFDSYYSGTNCDVEKSPRLYYSKILDGIKYSETDGSWTYIYTNNSYLSSGDSTFTLTNYSSNCSSEYIFAIVNEYADDSINKIVGKNEAIKKTDIFKTAGYNQQFIKFFRPVIAINPKEIKEFSGSGTKNNPYKLVAKTVTPY